MRRIPRWLKLTAIALAVMVVAIMALLTGLSFYFKRQMLDPGGRIPPRMAAYDVRHYDLAVRVDPETQSIEGSNTVSVEAVGEIQKFEIHLDDRLVIRSVQVDGG